MGLVVYCMCSLELEFEVSNFEYKLQVLEEEVAAQHKVGMA